VAASRPLAQEVLIGISRSEALPSSTLKTRDSARGVGALARVLRGSPRRRKCLVRRVSELPKESGRRELIGASTLDGRVEAPRGVGGRATVHAKS